MSWPEPTSEQQLWFLRNVQRLMDGQFSSTYKFALLQVLADLAVAKGDGSGAPLHLHVSDIAERFIELYWRQARPFALATAAEGAVLRQNAGKQAAMVAALSECYGRHGGSLPRFKSAEAEFEKTVRSFAQRVKTMPLWRLQKVGRETLEFLYPNVGSGDVIVLFPGVAYCFRRYHGLVSDLVRGAWLRFVRRLNSGPLGLSEDLMSFMFDQERSSLEPCRAALAEIQRGRCFYCEKNIKGAGAVDHFVPWARYPADLGHNFVLADSGCNNQKSDRLAAEKHLEAWVQRNAEHEATLDEVLKETGLASSLQTSVHIASWAYGETSQLGGLVWQEKQKLVPLGTAWRSLLS